MLLFLIRLTISPFEFSSLTFAVRCTAQVCLLFAVIFIAFNRSRYVTLIPRVWFQHDIIVRCVASPSLWLYVFISFFFLNNFFRYFHFVFFLCYFCFLLYSPWFFCNKCRRYHHCRHWSTIVDLFWALFFWCMCTVCVCTNLIYT